MYAVIVTGGKQYRVQAGDVIEVERLAGPEGEGFRFDRVLLVGGDGVHEVGNPTVAGAVVSASPVGETRGPKIRVFKKKRRKGYRRTRGHRQDLLRLKIDDIQLPSRDERREREP
ncbi:MAG TPA: 50S ribosomal protein L21 [Thermoanaerobaculia bacterium]|nr:50S ribosomal protein L21 [Thermoanaerobaculia bacterium]